MTKSTLRATVLLLVVLPSSANEVTCALGDPACSSTDEGLSLLQTKANKQKISSQSRSNEERTSMVDKVAMDTNITAASCPCDWSDAYPCSINGECWGYSSATSCQAQGGLFCGSSGSSSGSSSCTCTWDASYPCSIGGQCWGYTSASTCQNAGGQYCGNAPPPSPPPAPVSTPPPSSGDLSGAMQAVLDETNHYRGLHQAPPLTWNSNLASQAQSWADGCVFEHSSMGNGENLWVGSGSFNGAAAVTSWYDEINNYNYNDPGFSMATGHFTQLVWKSTTQVGCAVKLCSSIAGISNANFLVCEYSPPGNYQGEFQQNVLP